ncbi:MAG: DUF1292 domain-containing protein [Clostridia bacterium]
MNEEDTKTIILTDGEGCDTEFEVVATIDYMGKEFCVLLPFGIDADEFIILKVNGEEYEGISDQNILDAVFGEFLKKCGE